jgi:hypothetical protein
MADTINGVRALNMDSLSYYLLNHFTFRENIMKLETDISMH